MQVITIHWRVSIWDTVHYVGAGVQGKAYISDKPAEGFMEKSSFEPFQ